jgi:hypothetical protein
MKAEMPVRSYIVRIYRSERGRMPSLAGVVEEVGRKSRKAFTSFDELRGILTRKRARQRQRGKGLDVL